jgi:hypothetical protein
MCALLNLGCTTASVPPSPPDSHAISCGLAVENAALIVLPLDMRGEDLPGIGVEGVRSLLFIDCEFGATCDDRADVWVKSLGSYGEMHRDAEHKKQVEICRETEKRMADVPGPWSDRRRACVLRAMTFSDLRSCGLTK